MPRVSDAHREARRAQIVDAALRCFAEKGFQRTSMADIIEASGLSAGAIYLQFESKQDLVTATAQRVVGRRVDDIETLLSEPDPPDPDEFVRLVMEGLASEVRDSRLLVQLWGESFFEENMSVLVDSVFVRMRQAIVAYLARWAAVRRGLAPDAADEWGARTAPAMLGLMQGHILQSALLPGFDPAVYGAAVRELFR